MKRPLTLPLAKEEKESSPTPTLDEARVRLGGRAQTGTRTGQVMMAGGTAVVVIHDGGDELWVWLSEGRVKRVPSSSLVSFSLPPSADLARVAADAVVFGSLREGERVRWMAPDAELREGLLVEKCRFGALVAIEGDAIVAVAFRRLWPLGRAEG